MDIQQFSQVIELIKSLGVQSKEAFVWYLLFKEGLPFICSMTAIIAVFGLLLPAVKSFRCYSFFKEIKNQYGWKRGLGEYFDDIEFAETASLIKKALEEYTKNLK